MVNERDLRTIIEEVLSELLEKGELVDPTPDMADKFQIYTVERVSESGWKLISIENEKPTLENTASVTNNQPTDSKTTNLA